MGLPLAKARNLSGLRDRAPVSVSGDTASTPYLVEPQRRGSLGDLPFVNAAEDPSAVVFSRFVDGRWGGVTAAEFAAEVTAVAKGLIASGIGPGDRIALMSRTCYEWTLLDFAAWAAGAVLVPLYPTASSEQAAAILSDAKVAMVLAEDEACAHVLAAASPRRLDEGAIRELTSLGAPLPDAEVTRRRAALTPDSIATIIYTSGTTGTPKGAPLTHGNFLDAAANCTALMRPVFDSVSGEPPCTLLFLPLAHVLARAIEVCCVQARIRLGHSPSIKPAELRPDLESFGATFLVGVPYLFEKIHQLGRSDAQALHAARVYDRATKVAVRYGERALRSLAGEGPGPSLALRAEHALYDLLVYRKVRKALGGRIRYAISGGSALAPELLLFFAGAGVLIYEGYGLTETTGPSTVNPPLRPKPGTVGPPVPGAAVRIASDGEILLRGPQVFGGYDSGGSFVDGWFATGDLGRLDADGYLTITGRKKHLLVTSGGKNVSPGPLEDRIRAHPLISQCLVVGDGRSYIAALVTLDPESDAGASATGDASSASAPPAGGSAAAAGGGPSASAGDASASGGGVSASGGGVSAGGLVASAGGGSAAASAGASVGVQVESAIPVSSAVAAEIAQAVADANRSVSRAESIRRVRIVDGDFTEERGMLTPSLKVKRAAVIEAYAADIEALYT